MNTTLAACCKSTKSLLYITCYLLLIIFVVSLIRYDVPVMLTRYNLQQITNKENLKQYFS